MDRIKDITKLRLFKGGVLVKIHDKKKRLIHTIDEDTKVSKATSNFSHGEVVAKAENVDWVEIGDIILDFGSAEIFKWHEDQYCIILDMTINIVVTPDNFDIKKEKELAV